MSAPTFQVSCCWGLDMSRMTTHGSVCSPTDQKTSGGHSMMLGGSSGFIERFQPSPRVGAHPDNLAFMSSVPTPSRATAQPPRRRNPTQVRHKWWRSMHAFRSATATCITHLYDRPCCTKFLSPCLSCIAIAAANASPRKREFDRHDGTGRGWVHFQSGRLAVMMACCKC